MHASTLSPAFSTTQFGAPRFAWMDDRDEVIVKFPTEYYGRLYQSLNKRAADFDIELQVGYLGSQNDGSYFRFTHPAGYAKLTEFAEKLLELNAEEYSSLK